MSRRSTRRHLDVVISGGGTAGHVSPALAVAEALVSSGHARDAIGFVGSRRGMEARLVPQAGFSIVLLPGRGLRRRITAENLIALAELVVATIRAGALLVKTKPDVVMTVGGYASVPSALAARVLRIPVVVVNHDAVPGASNRLVGRFAAASAVAMPGTVLPRAVVTGSPVRPEILAVQRDDAGRRAAREKLGIDAGRFLVVTTGGSLGARTINDATLGAARILASRDDLAIYHVAGARDLDSVRTRLAEHVTATAGGLETGGLDAGGLEMGALETGGTGTGALDYRVVGFEPGLPEVLGAADLVVARAGASTVAELAVLGLASVLVPLPGAPSDHQRRNAELLASQGAAILVLDHECTGERLAAIISDLAADRGRVASMNSAAGALANRDAARRVAALVDDVAARRRPR